MDWFQTLSIIGTVIASAYYIQREMHEDTRIQSARTDKLYEMFVQIQNEIKDLHGRSCIIETKLEK